MTRLCNVSVECSYEERPTCPSTGRDFADMAASRDVCDSSKRALHLGRFDIREWAIVIRWTVYASWTVEFRGRCGWSITFGHCRGDYGVRRVCM